ncbi:helix-turn-helix domain-containing protein, partial [Enterococcus italicus]
MNFSKQLKKYRELNGYSQETLAEKIYVTRQTISKWENDKTYPDIHNLIALSVLFDITLDELVKGDVETMKK